MASVGYTRCPISHVILPHVTIELQRCHSKLRVSPGQGLRMSPRTPPPAVVGFNRQVGQYVQTLRMSRGWGRDDLAALAGVGRDAIYELEGDSPNPTLGTLVQVLWAFLREPPDAGTEPASPRGPNPPTSRNRERATPRRETEPRPTRDA
jgi:DNA-binding XRE family transcriptional regulator